MIAFAPGPCQVKTKLGRLLKVGGTLAHIRMDMQCITTTALCSLYQCHSVDSCHIVEDLNINKVYVGPLYISSSFS